MGGPSNGRRALPGRGAGGRRAHRAGRSRLRRRWATTCARDRRHRHDADARLVEGHAHLLLRRARNTDLGDIPPEEHVIETLHNARSCSMPASPAPTAPPAPLRLDGGAQRGERAAPACASRREPGDHRHRRPGRRENRAHEPLSFGIVADGPEAIVQAVRTCIREGVDNIKLNISGDDFVPAKGGMTVMRDPRCAPPARWRTTRPAWSRTCAPATPSSARCSAAWTSSTTARWPTRRPRSARGGRDRVFVGPAIGLIHNALYEARAWGITAPSRATGHGALPGELAAHREQLRESAACAW